MASASLGLPTGGRYRHSLSVSGEKQGFKDGRTSFTRGLFLYRGAADLDAGTFRLDVNAALVNQEPASPTPRTGAGLSPLVPVDSNQNPRGAKIDEGRFALVGGYDRKLDHGIWSTTLSVSRTHRTTGRGFLTAVANTDPNANGFRQRLTVTDVYFDTHLALALSPELELVAGFDHLYGKADQHSEDFDYFASLNGTNLPSLSDLAPAGKLTLGDERNFSGLYLQAEWNPTARWKVQAGGRLNHTREGLAVTTVEVASGEGGSGRDRRTTTRGSGTVGVSYVAWQGRDAAVWAYADTRSTFKPAALDFGPDAQAEVLNPETSTSVEAGLKGRFADGRVDWDLSAFQMDFENLVVPVTTTAGFPGLVNAGKERFKGIELEVGVRLRRDLLWQVAYSFHDPRFRDYVRAFDGVNTQLAGNRLEMSAENMATTSLVYSPRGGLTGSVMVNHVGSRFLNMRNTAIAPAYATWSAALGYRAGDWELRLEGCNLNDTRPPIAESELGDAQYYRLPSRSFRLSWLVHL